MPGGGPTKENRRARMQAMFLVSGAGVLLIGIIALYAETRILVDAGEFETVNSAFIRSELIPVIWFFLFAVVGVAEIILFLLANYLRREELRGGFLDRLFRRVVEQGPAAIIFVSVSGTVIYESPSAQQVLGYTPTEFVGRRFSELVHPDDLAFARVHFASLVKALRSTSTIQLRMKHRDGTWHWIEAVSTNFLDQPSTRAIVSSLRDITGRLRDEERELVRALRAQTPEIRETKLGGSPAFGQRRERKTARQ